MKEYELKAMYDSRARFYGKAVVKDYRNKKVLYSYNNEVCTIENDDFKLNSNIRKDLLFSQTTTRHIKEFIYQELKRNLTTKELKASI